jgi:hypothetical protein
LPQASFKTTIAIWIVFAGGICIKNSFLKKHRHPNYGSQSAPKPLAQVCVGSKAYLSQIGNLFQRDRFDFTPLTLCYAHYDISVVFLKKKATSSRFAPLFKNTNVVYCYAPSWSTGGYTPVLLGIE